MSIMLEPRRPDARTDARPGDTRPGDTGVRASDAEREVTVTRLHDALGEGRLDLAENETRVAAAYAARYRHELPPLLGDLPGARDRLDGVGAPTWAAIATAIVWRLRLLCATDPRTAASRPGPQQRRRVALIVGAVVLWLLVCFVLGVVFS